MWNETKWNAAYQKGVEWNRLFLG